MNKSDRELFELLESAWVRYYSKCENREEIPWQAEGLMGKIQTYEGDLPESGAYKPDMMPATVDKFRKFYITDLEYFAAKMMFKVPKALRDFVMIEPIIRRKENVTQVMIAHVCNCSLDQYKKRRARAKAFLVALVRARLVKNPQIADLEKHVVRCLLGMRGADNFALKAI